MGLETRKYNPQESGSITDAKIKMPEIKVPSTPDNVDIAPPMMIGDTAQDAAEAYKEAHLYEEAETVKTIEELPDENIEPLDDLENDNNSVDTVESLGELKTALAENEEKIKPLAIKWQNVVNQMTSTIQAQMEKGGNQAPITEYTTLDPRDINATEASSDSEKILFETLEKLSYKAEYEHALNENDRLLDQVQNIEDQTIKAKKIA